MHKHILATLMMALALVAAAPAAAEQTHHAGETLGLLLSRADAHRDGGDFASASLIYRQLANAVRRDFPENREGLALALDAAGSADLALGRYRDALEMLEEATRISAEVYGADHRATIQSRAGYAHALRGSGHLSEAVAQDRLILAIEEARSPVDHGRVGHAAAALGISLSNNGRLDEAEIQLRRAVAIFRSADGADDRALSSAVFNLAATLQERAWLTGDRRLVEAEVLLREAIALNRNGATPDEDALAMSLGNLGQLLSGRERLIDAEAALAEAYTIRQRLSSGTNPELASIRLNYGLLLERTGRGQEAEPLIRQALEAWEVTLGPAHERTLLARRSLASLLARSGRIAETHILYLEALRAIAAQSCLQDSGVACEPLAGLVPTAAMQGTARLVSTFSSRGAARSFLHAGDALRNRTRRAYNLRAEARQEFRRYAYVNQWFVAAAWAANDPDGQADLIDLLSTR